MKRWVKISLGAAGFAGAAALGWFLLSSPRTTDVVTGDVVRRTDLEQTVEVTGDLQSVDDVQLAFDRSGIVESVRAAVGDTVRAGDVLASLDAGELEAAYARSLGVVREAVANIELRRIGISDEEQAVSEADVSVAEAALAAAQSSVERVRAVGDAAVAEAEATLASTVTQTAEARSQAREDLVESLRSLVAQVRASLADADSVLAVENSLFNNDFQDVLANTDSQALISATNAFETAADSRDAVETALFATDTSDIDAVRSLATRALDAYADTYETLLQTSRVLDATSSDSADFSIDDLKTLKSTIATSLASLVSDGTSATDARQAYEDAERDEQDDVEAAANALATAEAARERDIVSSEAAVVSREADLARARAALGKVTAAPRDVDLASYEASVVQAQADADAALARLNGTRIVAPIDGVVTSVDVDPGETVAGGAGVVTVLSSGLDYEIALDIPESDITKTRVGQDATITFDAFGDDTVFRGTLSTIDPAQRLIEGVVFYEAKVLLSEDQDLTALKPGMSADVTLHTASRSGALAVPTRAVLERDGEKYVRIPAAGGSFEERPVTVGLRADGGLTEILDGLSEGDAIIVSIRKQAL